MESLAEKVVKILIKKKLTISFAESCTGGMLSSVITSVGGSSKVFALGLVAYSNMSKIKILKVPKNTIRKYGSVSEQVCLAMLKNLNKISKTNISVSITGIAGPSGGTKIKPVGLVYVGIKKGNRAEVKKYLFKNKGRSLIQKYGAVSEKVSLIMTRNISKFSKSNISLSVTGIAGPDGGTKNKPVGLVYVGIKKGNKIKVKKYLFKNRHRIYIQKTTVNKSLDLILRAFK